MLCQVMIVDSIFNKGKCYKFLFLKFLFLFLGCYKFHPSCFSRWIDDLALLFLLNRLLFYFSNRILYLIFYLFFDRIGWIFTICQWFSVGLQILDELIHYLYRFCRIELLADQLYYVCHLFIILGLRSTSSTCLLSLILNFRIHHFKYLFVECSFSCCYSFT